MLSKTYTITPGDVSTLTNEIQQSSMTVALEGINRNGDDFECVFKADITAEEALLDAVVAAHTGEPYSEPRVVALDPASEHVVHPTHLDTGGLQPGWKSELWTAQAGAQSVFDIPIVQELKLAGGVYEIFEGAAKGDYVEFSIVDKDDLLGYFTPLGLVVGTDVFEIVKYVETEYINPNQSRPVKLRHGSAFKVVPGLYFRTSYVSVGATDVDFKVRLETLK